MIPNRLRDAAILGAARLGWHAARRGWHGWRRYRTGARRVAPTSDAVAKVAPVEMAKSLAPADPGTPIATRAHLRLRRLALVPLDLALILAAVLVVFVGYGMIGNRWYHIVAVEGGSMEPTIMRGDLIVVTPAPEKVEPGMILVMGVDGRVVTHRVVAVRPDGYLVTKGDANQVADDWQGKPITVFGQYQFRIPEIGRYIRVSNASGATFKDRDTASQTITVATWPTPPLAESAGAAESAPAPEPPPAP